MSTAVAETTFNTSCELPAERAALKAAVTSTPCETQLASKVSGVEAALSINGQALLIPPASFTVADASKTVDTAFDSLFALAQLYPFK